MDRPALLAPRTLALEALENLCAKGEKYAIILQMEAAECGAAALQLSLHLAPGLLEQFVSHVACSRDGVRRATHPRGASL